MLKINQIMECVSNDGKNTKVKLVVFNENLLNHNCAETKCVIYDEENNEPMVVLISFGFGEKGDIRYFDFEKDSVILKYTREEIISAIVDYYI